MYKFIFKAMPKVSFGFDIYLKLTSKYIMYIRNGDDIEQERLKQLKTKKVRQMFIADSDEENYQDFLDNSLSAAATDPNLTAEDKAETASGVANAAVEDLHDDPESIQSYKSVERASKGIADIVGKNTDVLLQFYKKVQESDGDPVFKHAISITALAVCLAEHLQMTSDEISDIAAASMVLDIGMTKMKDKKDLFTKNYKDFTPQDWIAYKKHPELSCEIVEGKSYINPRVLQLVKTHEERKSGSGFPEGIVNLDLDQNIVAICNCYDRFITCDGMSHKDAIQEMIINQVGNFDLELIQKFKAMMKKQGIGA